MNSMFCLFFYNLFTKVLPFTMTSATDSASPMLFTALHKYLPVSYSVIPLNYK